MSNLAKNLAIGVAFTSIGTACSDFGLHAANEAPEGFEDTNDTTPETDPSELDVGDTGLTPDDTNDCLMMAINSLASPELITPALTDGGLDERGERLIAQSEMVRRTMLETFAEQGLGIDISPYRSGDDREGNLIALGERVIDELTGEPITVGLRREIIEDQDERIVRTDREIMIVAYAPDVHPEQLFTNIDKPHVVCESRDWADGTQDFRFKVLPHGTVTTGTSGIDLNSHGMMIGRESNGTHRVHLVRHGNALIGHTDDDGGIEIGSWFNDDTYNVTPPSWVMNTMIDSVDEVVRILPGEGDAIGRARFEL